MKLGKKKQGKKQDTPIKVSNVISSSDCAIPARRRVFMDDLTRDIERQIVALGKPRQPAFKSVEEEELEHQQEDNAADANFLIRQALGAEQAKLHPQDGIANVEAGVDGRIRVTVRFPGERYPRLARGGLIGFGAPEPPQDPYHERKYILTVEEEKTGLF